MPWAVMTPSEDQEANRTSDTQMDIWGIDTLDSSWVKLKEN